MTRFTPASLPPHIADRMPEKDRRALGIETTGEHAERMAVELERDLQRQCEAYLRQKEIEYLHLSTRSREKQGWPDLVFACDGQAIAVELKSASGLLSAEQSKCLERLAKNGWETHVCRTFAHFRAVVRGALSLTTEPQPGIGAP